MPNLPRWSPYRPLGAAGGAGLFSGADAFRPQRGDNASAEAVGRSSGRMEAVEEKFRELWELVGNEGGEATVPPHYMRLA